VLLQLTPEGLFGCIRNRRHAAFADKRRFSRDSMTSCTDPPGDVAGLELSVIIPSLNEEATIAHTLRSIRSSLEKIEHEIIVVDNGSIDGTVVVAREMADRLIVARGALIGEMRNRGAELARGEILLFNDADVILTEEWANAYRALREDIRATKLVVGGSLQVSNPSNRIHRYWFQPLLKKREERRNHVGTGNMVVSRRLFSELHGFNPTLRTGEDYDFCTRARASGAVVSYSSKLEAVHLGYPTTILEFFRREHWHGKGDLQSIDTVLASKSAMISLLTALLISLAVLSAALAEFQWALSLLVVVAVLVASTSYHRASRVGSPLGRGYHLALTLTQCIARATAGIGSFHRAGRDVSATRVDQS
jgi:cellulose synthase/poly-beta-1,6-N-acetylglucosamine synthase-like glycosyltransferase